MEDCLVLLLFIGSLLSLSLYLYLYLGPSVSLLSSPLLSSSSSFRSQAERWFNGRVGPYDCRHGDSLHTPTHTNKQKDTLRKVGQFVLFNAVLLDVWVYCTCHSVTVIREDTECVIKWLCPNQRVGREKKETTATTTKMTSMHCIAIRGALSWVYECVCVTISTLLASSFLFNFLLYSSFPLRYTTTWRPTNCDESSMSIHTTKVRPHIHFY